MKHLVGKLLIAPPAIKGSFFQESVILLTEDLGQQQIGIVLNKPSRVTLTEFSRQNNVRLSLPGNIYIGGPASPRAFTMIHSAEWVCSNTMKVNNQFSISSSPEILDRLAAGDTPSYWRAFVGLCSWENGKLHKELNGVSPYSRNNSWLVATPDISSVFVNDGTSQWTDAVEMSCSEFVKNFFV